MIRNIEGKFINMGSITDDEFNEEPFNVSTNQSEQVRCSEVSPNETVNSLLDAGRHGTERIDKMANLMTVCKFTQECFFSDDCVHNPINIENIDSFCLVIPERRMSCYFEFIAEPNIFINYKGDTVIIPYKKDEIESPSGI